MGGNRSRYSPTGGADGVADANDFTIRASHVTFRREVDLPRCELCTYTSGNLSELSLHVTGMINDRFLDLVQAVDDQ